LEVWQIFENIKLQKKKGVHNFVKTPLYATIF